MLIDFEGTMGDELTVKAGDVVKNVRVASEEGWLEGDLRGRRGIFPSNFVKVRSSFGTLKIPHVWVARRPIFFVNSFLISCFLSMQEVPVHLMGDSKREPRSMRKCMCSFHAWCSNVQNQNVH